MRNLQNFSNLLFGTATLILLLKPMSANSQDFFSLEVCQQGKLECVDRVIQEMERRYEMLIQAGDPDALFALNYLRTTETFRLTLNEIEYSDTASVIRQDALFADYYFRSYDNYHFGTGSVPPAWQIAFDAAKNRSVTGLGQIALGINAHIQRDFPFVLYELYRLGYPVSYEDHLRANQFLRQVDVLDELVQLDSSILRNSSPDIEEQFQVITTWRNGAFKNFERLREASTTMEVNQVVAKIEENSAASANAILRISQLPSTSNTSVSEPDLNIQLMLILLGTGVISKFSSLSFVIQRFLKRNKFK